MFSTLQLEISGTDKMLNLPGFLLHPLPNSWCKARAMSCLPTEGGDLLCLAPILPVRPLIASHVQRLVTAAPGAELSRCSVLLYCAASILHELFWSTLTMVSISLLSLDLASRAEGWGSGCSPPAMGRRCWAWGTFWFSPCCGGSGKHLMDMVMLLWELQPFIPGRGNSS